MNQLLQRTAGYINRPYMVAWILLFPSLICLTVFVFIPLIIALILSFYDVNIFLKDISFVGIQNYTQLFGDSRFWNSFFNTLYYIILYVPLSTAASLGAALYVQKNTLYRKMVRSMLYIPAICSMTAVSIIWAILLDPTIGMVAYWFRSLGFEGVQFLKDPNLAMPLVAIISAWKNFGLNMMIFVAALQAIPDDYHHAAQIDGAGALKRFAHITIPCLMPTLGFCIITNVINSFMVFDQTYVMTGGGPLFRTETIAQYIYMRGFKISPFRLGYASATSEFLTVVIAAVSFVLYRFFTKKETEVL